MPIEEVWLEYQRSADGTIRNYLMERYLPLVRYNAERIYTRLPDEVDLEDLMSAGLFGLMDAIDAFDLERKVKFETYCAPRIRGAILDELRSMDWVPRLVRQRTGKVDQIRQKIEMETGATATEEDIAERLG
ncbi:MAG: sigma-70 family RNA polymerase sigma factor, partial [Phycisphaerales bacterium]|nr:sigma-70 family RNA polymerase sigma factor [Phycisphaerales bacterium]